LSDVKVDYIPMELFRDSQQAPSPFFVDGKYAPSVIEHQNSLSQAIRSKLQASGSAAKVLMGLVQNEQSALKTLSVVLKMTSGIPPRTTSLAEFKIFGDINSEKPRDLYILAREGLVFISGGQKQYASTDNKRRALHAISP
jgi:hypothetical protein